MNTKRAPRMCGNRPDIRHVWLALAVLAAYVLTGCRAPDIGEAEEAFAQFTSDRDAAVHAHARGDGDAAQRHQVKAAEALARARALFAKTAAARPDDVDVLRKCATVLSQCGDTDLAAEAFEHAVTLAPDDAGLWLGLGQALSTLGHGRAAEAVEALRHALDAGADSAATANALASLGAVYRREGLHDLARQSYAKALEAGEDNVAAKLGLAGYKLRDGDVRACSDDLDALQPLAPEYAMQLPGLLADALEGFEDARRWFPDTAGNHMAFAKLLVRASRLSEGLAAAERAAVLDASDYITWNFVGGIARQLGDVDRARRAYERSLELKPDQPRTLEALEALGEKKAES